jgi:hypothetical protein
MEEDSDGKYVLHEEYSDLERQLAAKEQQNKELLEAGIAMLDADCEDAMFEASNLMEKALGTHNKTLSGG